MTMNLEKEAWFPLFHRTHLGRCGSYTNQTAVPACVIPPNLWERKNAESKYGLALPCSLLFHSSASVKLPRIYFPASDGSRAGTEFLESRKTLNLAIQTPLAALDLCPLLASHGSLGLARLILHADGRGSCWPRRTWESRGSKASKALSSDLANRTHIPRWELMKLFQRIFSRLYEKGFCKQGRLVTSEERLKTFSSKAVDVIIKKIL